MAAVPIERGQLAGRLSLAENTPNEVRSKRANLSTARSTAFAYLDDGYSRR